MVSPTAIRHVRSLVRVALLGVVVATGLLSGTAAVNAKVSATLIQQRAIGMLGLSIGLGLVTLISQFNTVIGAAALQPGECSPLYDGGTIKVLSSKVNQGNIDAHVQLYFDDSCVHVYMDEDLVVRPKGTKYVFDGIVDVYARSGKKVGELTVTKNALVTTAKGDELYGPATFKPTGNAPLIHLGLSCELPDSTFFSGNDAPKALPASIDGPAAKKTFDCVGGSAQKFPKVKKSIAALTRLILRKQSGHIVLEQTEPGETMLGRPGSLSVKVTSMGEVKITGKAKPWSTDALSGERSNFVVFPSEPTSWQIVDTALQSEFAIDYRKNGKTVYEGAVNGKDGTPLAPFTLDASGSGKITYSDGVKANISSWTLSK